jgi:hypothetical protein
MKLLRQIFNPSQSWLFGLEGKYVCLEVFSARANCGPEGYLERVQRAGTEVFLVLRSDPCLQEGQAGHVVRRVNLRDVRQLTLSLESHLDGNAPSAPRQGPA